MKTVLIVTDAWHPMTNGVVTTLTQTVLCLQRFGYEVRVIEPSAFRTVPCPSYPEIRIAVLAHRRMRALLDGPLPYALHIATEGPLGWAARRYCLQRGLHFTSSYHTQFPQYLRSRAPVPLRLSYALIRRFHAAAEHCMVSTASMHRELTARGFTNLVHWSRGVNTELFRPRPKSFLALPRPIAVYAGRLAVEKNVEAFLEMPWSGTKLVIGDGPQRRRLEKRFATATFVGYRYGEDLAAHLAAADVLVFPSRTDTFGLVNLEAMACGVPVAAYPVTGPIDVVRDGLTGALDEDLGRAARRALEVDPQECREHALRSAWEACARQFDSHLVECLAVPSAQRARRGALVKRSERALP
ncbi:MAG: glycosyltransferase family 4 protein [Steroidobacteraceae bacterium]